MTIDHTQHPPEKWQEILQLALTDLRINPRDSEALQAIRDANEALNAYEQPDIQAGNYDETSIISQLGSVAQGFGKAAVGFPGAISELAGQFGRGEFVDAAKTVGSGVARLATSPFRAIAAGLSGRQQTPEELEGFGGDIFGLGLPVAAGRLGKVVPGRTGSALRSAGGPTISGAVRGIGEVVARPFRSAGDILARQGLKNKLLNEQIEGTRLGNEARRANAQKPPTRVAPMAEEQLIGRQLQNELLKQRLEASGEPMPGEPIPMSPIAPVSPRPVLEPMPGTPGGYTVEGPPTPPVRTEPTLVEMQQGFKEPPIPRKGQKALEFGEKGQKSAFSQLTKDEIKQLLGDIARSQGNR